MGSNQFQREYIEYLQKLNTELLDRLNQMKQNYECKILSKDWNRNHLISVLEEVLNVCTLLPQEIDIFFEKISAAMGAFKNILLRKSEMLQVMEKVNKALNSTISIDQMGIENSESGVGKKVGTVKVSPMIKGHIILTDPRIHLSRVPRVFTSSERRETHQLSPIMEASPDTSADPSNLGLIFKEVKIPLERINPNKMCYSFINEESPKSRFKGPKTWKKSLSSGKFQDHQRNIVSVENNENTKKKFSTENNELPQLENVDPQEGPSWLYEENSEINSSSSCYFDFKRRKNRFATVFDNVEDNLSCFEKPKKSMKRKSSELNKKLSIISEEEVVEKINNTSIRDSSDNFIQESFSSEREENYSPLKKQIRKTKRGSRRSSVKKNSKKFSRDFEEKTSTPYSEKKRKKSVSHSPAYSDSSDEEDNMKTPLPILMKDRKSFKKSPVKLLRERMSGEVLFGNTPSRIECGEPEEHITKRYKNSKKSPVKSDILENQMYTELEDCMVDKKYSPRPLKSENVVEKKSRKDVSKSKSRSPVGILEESVGRVKRKAAPTFKLVEPQLRTKLRRN